jgi:hypothetical protein
MSKSSSKPCNGYPTAWGAMVEYHGWQPTDVFWDAVFVTATAR